MVEDGVTGRLVPPSDPESLAEAIVGLLGDEPKRMEMEKSIRSVYWNGEKSSRQDQQIAWWRLMANWIDLL